ncbi:histone-lysine N-methyltransferase SETMAR-like [Oopsacas minuta]|uniref:Histone-lysine N-methyltransferase SETMAR-like n=1 Tax=Oopsacas minuta TaxID=111878 RepID=A0AAV7K059_9METZ|nr:histone-lysine N-methyltransferase SETMAR-like [Oopsacas minuta]
MCGNFILKTNPPWTTPYAVTEGIVESIEDMVIADPNVTYERIQHEIGISFGAVHTILHQSLQLRKPCSRWIPHKLNPEQKQNRVKWCHEMLKKFNNGNSRDVSKIITGDETWIYHYDPETKQKSRRRCENGEGPPTKGRRTQYIKKQMYANFFNTTGMKTVVPFEPGKTINSTWFTEKCLPLVIEAMNLQCPGTGLRGTFLRHDNASSHTSKMTR